MSEFNNQTDIGAVYREREPITARLECSRDFVLPDYLGDVKRIIKGSAGACPVNKFIGDDSISFLWSVTFSILYLDGEDKLTEARFSADLEHSEKTDGEIADADMKCRISSVSLRLSGPRKMTAKAAMVGEICVTDAHLPDFSDIEESAERLDKSVMIHTATYMDTEEREYAEEIARFEDVGKDEIEVKFLRCEPAGAFAEIKDGRVTVTSTVNACAVVSVDGMLTHVEKTFKIDQSASIDTITEEPSVLCETFINDFRINLNEESGEDMTVATTAVITMNAKSALRIDANKPCNVVCDAFVPGMKNECAYEKIEYESVLSSAKEAIEIETSVARDEGVISDILLCECEISSYNVEIDNGDAVLSGELDFLAIALNAEGMPYVIRADKTFNERIKAPVTRKNIKIRPYVKTCDAKATSDSEKVYFSCSVCVEMLFLEIGEEMCVSRLKFFEGEKCDRRRISVYYPEKDETGWDIARRYSVRLCDLIAKNPSSFDSSMKVLSDCIYVEK